MSHLTIERSGRYETTTFRNNDNNIVSLITKLTTETSIKSIVINPWKPTPNQAKYLKFWYCKPFGECILPEVGEQYNIDMHVCWC